MSDIDNFIDLVRSIYRSNEFIPLHEPKFNGNEASYVQETIRSSYVSSIGKFVDSFEEAVANYTGVGKSVAVVNGTSALQVSLKLAGVTEDMEVITQALTVVATANAISYNNAKPIFLDVDQDTMGLSPKALMEFLEEYGEVREDGCYNKLTLRKISAIVPMHTFGFMCRIEEIIEIARKWHIPVVEDAAESFGSFYRGKHSGTFGLMGAFSFNGNKLITSGGGGAIISENSNYMQRAKHIVTTAKKTHPWEYYHDELGFNFRMPNLNAALALAQLERVNELIESKKEVFEEYENGLEAGTYKLKSVPPDTKWNYWLIALEFENREERDYFLRESNENEVMTRPIWRLMYDLPMYRDCFKDAQKNAIRLADSIVNIPSSARV
jgi:aminotransferase in exopolysaccharide biosynthesis